DTRLFSLLSVRYGDPCPVLEDRAKNLATNVLFASLVIGHHALRGRKDGDAEAVRDLRNGLYRDINPATRLRHAADLTDHRCAFVVLQLDFDLGLAVIVVDLGITADVAFGLQDVEHAHAQLGSWRRDGRLAAGCAIADAGEHIAQRISHGHSTVSLPARLDDARHLAEAAQITKRDTRHLELAIESARATGDFATVTDTRLRAIARQ